MHERSLAAAIIACLAAAPDGAWTIGEVATRCGCSDVQAAAACASLEVYGLIERNEAGSFALKRPPCTAAAPIVLVVENTAAVAHLLAALLESEGYRVLIATTTALGEQVGRSVPLDLVIADSFSATARDALARLSELRRSVAPAPVLIFTAHRDIDESAAQAAGYSGMLPKPFDIDDLLQRVATVIAERRAES